MTKCPLEMDPTTWDTGTHQPQDRHSPRRLITAESSGWCTTPQSLGKKKKNHKTEISVTFPSVSEPALTTFMPASGEDPWQLSLQLNDQWEIKHCHCWSTWGGLHCTGCFRSPSDTVPGRNSGTLGLSQWEDWDHPPTRAGQEPKQHWLLLPSLMLFCQSYLTILNHIYFLLFLEVLGL
jgi:hypothetical protein